MEASSVVSALESEGIEARATGTFTSSFQAEAPGDVEVVVRQSEAEQARAILDKLD